MKSIECIDCNVIQDLLPSYCDGITNESSNKLIEGHLKKCKNCRKILEEMNKEVGIEYEKNQEERINYLKGYRRNLIRSIIFTISLILDIILIVNLISVYSRFYVNVNDINIYNNMRYFDEGIERLNFYIYNEKYTLLLDDEYKKVDEEGNVSLYMRFNGRMELEGGSAGTAFCIELEDKLERAYIEDTKGNKREIWNKYDGVKVNTIIN